MLHILPRSQGNVLGIECSGKVSREDYLETLEPALNRVIAEHGQVRVLFIFGEDFEGYKLEAMLEDIRYGFKHMKRFEKLATINAPSILVPILKLFDKVSKCRCKNFDRAAADEAWGWIEG